MNLIRYLFILFFLSCINCSQSPHDSLGHVSTCVCDTIIDSSSVNLVRGALLGSRFKSLAELKSVIQIQYFNDNTDMDSSLHENSKVIIMHCSNGREVINVLEAGITQGDMSKAKNGSFMDELHFLFSSPYAVSNRMDLNKINLLARRRTDLFGEGDPSFYDLAVTARKNINTPDLAFINTRDSSEKGYINSFNHITSQSFMTSLFSEQFADFIGDSHERYYHPELITGKFSEHETNDLDNGPVDNYVDLINNEWGQQLGKDLKEKYKISEETYWTPQLLANYLNDIQSYYSWAFQIGFTPFSMQDEVVVRFSNKLNLVMLGEQKIRKT